MSLREVDRDLWAAEAPLRVGGLELGARTTLVRLVDGGVVVHSPGPLDAERQAAAAKLGPVRALLAPSLLHHLHLEAWSRAFPGARVFGAPGLSAKRPGLHIDEALGDAPPTLWAADLDQLLVAGMPRANEVAFLHRASRTLIVTDLVFHIRVSDHRPTRIAMRLNGVYGRFGPSRLMRWVVTRDRTALRTSVERILAWDFERVIMAHGEVLERGGREALRESFDWLGLRA